MGEKKKRDDEFYEEIEGFDDLEAMAEEVNDIDEVIAEDVSDSDDDDVVESVESEQSSGAADESAGKADSSASNKKKFFMVVAGLAFGFLMLLFVGGILVLKLVMSGGAGAPAPSMAKRPKAVAKHRKMLAGIPERSGLQERSENAPAEPRIPRLPSEVPLKSHAVSGATSSPSESGSNKPEVTPPLPREFVKMLQREQGSSLGTGNALTAKAPAGPTSRTAKPAPSAELTTPAKKADLQVSAKPKAQVAKTEATESAAKLAGAESAGVTRAQKSEQKVALPVPDVATQDLALIVKFTPEGVKLSGQVVKDGMWIKTPLGFIKVKELHNTYLLGETVNGKEVRVKLFYVE